MHQGNKRHIHSTFLQRQADRACVLLQGVGLLLMLVTTDMVLLITYSTYAMTLTNLGCMCALFWFRYREPDRHRPFKVS